MHDCRIESTLRASGLRLTKDRHRLLELFEDGRTWSAAQIHEQMPETDLSTVYRNIHSLIQKGLLAQVHAHGGETQYERAGQTHHDHAKCESCQTTRCVPCPTPKLPEHHLELIQLCATCA